MEHARDDRACGAANNARMHAIAATQDGRYAHDYETNARLRGDARGARGDAAAALAAGAALGLRAGIPLLPPTRDDASFAMLVMTAAAIERGGATRSRGGTSALSITFSS